MAVTSLNRFGLVLVCCFAVASGCGGDDSSGKEPACAPNASVACTGPGNCSGYQVCAADGSGYSACDCADAASGGSSGAAGSGGASGSGGTVTDGGGAGGVGGAAGSGGGAGGTGTGGAGGTGGSPIGGTGGIGTGGGGTGGAGADAATCSGACQKRAAATCSKEEAYAACYTDCVADFPTFKAACGTQTSAWYSCFNSTATTACSSTGYVKHSGCNAEWTEYLKCAACTVAPSDATCESCTKTKCCQQYQSVYSHPQWGSYLACMYACTTQTCEGNCAFSYAGVVQALQVAAACRTSSCGC